MVRERLYYKDESIKDDKEGKKEYKRIADLAKLTLKFYKKIEVYSESQKQVVAYVKDSEEGINPGWCGIDFLLDDMIPDLYFENGGMIKKITFGTVIDSKHEDQEIEIVDQLVI